MTSFHVEVAKKLHSQEKRNQVERLVRGALELDNLESFEDFQTSEFLDRYPYLKEHVLSMRIYQETKKNPWKKSKKDLIAEGKEALTNGDHKKDARADMYLYVHHLNEDGEEAEFMDEDENDQSAAASHNWILPSASFEGLWDSLVFESDVQSRLMKYINSALLFSEKGVDSNLIAWNKVILLHGPPGTGKTSLCKALAQKAAIRLGNRYSHGQLIEINSHSLFSKWFSESGKLVMKMFERIHDLVEDSKCLVFLLIDEVESLAQCRQSAEAGNEPTDSIRAVNALLTQIDRIKKYPNVVILTTSNIVGSIDLAFVDRADLKIYIGPPPVSIIFGILSSSINELIRVGIIESSYTFSPNSSKEIQEPFVKKLQCISKLASGMSGRTLRKMPFLAHANFIEQANCNLDTFLQNLEMSVETEMKEVGLLQRKPKS